MWEEEPSLLSLAAAGITLSALHMNHPDPHQPHPQLPISLLSLSWQEDKATAVNHRGVH